MDLDKTSAEIYKSILYRAADIYQIEYDDIDRDFGNSFDPIIRFMSGALASELEKVYQYVDDSEMRLQRRLAQVLLPEYFHLPKPAHALMRADALSDQFIVDETVEFLYKSERDEEPVAFSPILTSRVLPVQIKFIATEKQLIDTENRPRLQRRKTTLEADEVQKLLVGFRSAEPITNWQGATLYFDLKGASGESTERARLLDAVKQASCFFQKSKLATRFGLPTQEIQLEDKLNGNEKYQNSARLRYENHFLTFADTFVEEKEPKSSKEELIRWFEKSEQFTVTPEFSANLEEADEEMNWIEIHLNRPVKLTQVTARLTLEFNVFPVGNRRLNGHERGVHHWLKNQSVKWIQLQPEEDFVAIRKVYEENPPEYTQFIYKPFAEFKEDQVPSYTLRHGGVGRWDNYNAWHRLSYLVNTLKENYRQDELINEAAGALSLEDIHSLLGKKIAKGKDVQNPARDIYILLHSGSKAGVRARVEYWTSIGAKANGIPAKSKLKCISKHKSRFDAEAIELITPTSEGHDPLSPSKQLTAMKSALLGRGRIVTREDLKDFCKLHLSDRITKIEVEDTVGTDPRFDFGMTRMIQVTLHPARGTEKEDWEGVCVQVQTQIEQLSASNIPYRVITKDIISSQKI